MPCAVTSAVLRAYVGQTTDRLRAGEGSELARNRLNPPAGYDSTRLVSETT